MTDQSRVEAVARAMEARADGLYAYRDSHHGIDPQTWLQIAKAAIEASDAWLQGLGAFKAIYTCTSCGDEFEMTMATVQPCIQCKDGSRLLSIQEIKR